MPSVLMMDKKDIVFIYMDKKELSLRIKAEAKNLGFFACGIAKADDKRLHTHDNCRNAKS